MVQQIFAVVKLLNSGAFKIRGIAMTDKDKLKPVIVRTHSAGVHFGYLVDHNGQEVRLESSRRIWRWFGANTLSELATFGLDIKSSRVAVPVSIVLTQAIEIIDCTSHAVASIEAAKWAD